jgi:F-type H+-transporting ATPase subunit b
MLTFPPDFSFVIQVVSFLLLWAALKRLAFDPILGVLAERDARTAGNLATAESLRVAAQADEEKFETSLRYVRQTVLVEAEAARKLAETEQQRALTAARAAADAELARLRADVSTQVANAQRTLAAEARNIGALMAERICGRPLT